MRHEYRKKICDSQKTQIHFNLLWNSRFCLLTKSIKNILEKALGVWFMAFFKTLFKNQLTNVLFTLWQNKRNVEWRWAKIEKNPHKRKNNNLSLPKKLIAVKQYYISERFFVKRKLQFYVSAHHIRCHLTEMSKKISIRSSFQKYCGGKYAPVF